MNPTKPRATTKDRLPTKRKRASTKDERPQLPRSKNTEGFLRCILVHTLMPLMVAVLLPTVMLTTVI